MTTDTTRKDKTPQEIIRWCDKRIRPLLDDNGRTRNDRDKGAYQALLAVRNHCLSMLDHPGSTPSGAPDRSEGNDSRNPFQCQRDEMTTMDMHTCDLCGAFVPSPVYSVLVAYGDQAKTATEVCANCMQRLKFRPVRTVPLTAYREYEAWVAEHQSEDTK